MVGFYNFPTDRRPVPPLPQNSSGVTLFVPLDNDVYEDLREEAIKEKLPLAELAHQAILEFLKNKRKKKKK